ncbi:hypothetical protein WAI453_010253 [Rhynchosporium graminicola]|uniref:2EXR domain-containing protein n=1 Tax=Rhynchosporium graminicola TaxID=2792576 RepID=A0A1E1KFV0_9HELO|nr:uncharacterized protein RCO7_02687 [Rhynchosporium commune]
MDPTPIANESSPQVLQPYPPAIRTGVIAAADPLTLFTPKKPATTFSFFPNLPAELRTMIYEWAVAEAQPVELERGICPIPLLSACYEARALLYSRYTTWQGSISRPFKVTFRTEKDPLYITAIENAFWIPSTISRRTISLRQGNRVILVRQPRIRCSNRKSLAGINRRASSMICLLCQTDQGAHFLASFQKLRLDIRLLQSSTFKLPSAKEDEMVEWSCLWEDVIDDFKGAKEVEMRFSKGSMAYPLPSHQREKERSKKVSEIATFTWNIQRAVFVAAVGDWNTGFSAAVKETVEVILDGARFAEKVVRGGGDGYDHAHDGLPVLTLPKVVFTMAEG